MAAAGSLVRSLPSAWTRISAASAMLPSAAAMLARPIARVLPLVAAAGSLCGAATLGMAAAADLQDPFMWGRHDKRTKKGKRHIGTYGKIRPRKPDATPFSQDYWGQKMHWIPPGGGSGSPPRTD
eukprot:CAMPEP_0179444696 /NCGR_PEP_ID=MMETSP0799-20121207/28123_1 /TAXON_ID=46947 /ORGANISM="Geminigera cryophila, Strain CCMP2564" /LENGTH=124 /DNA_ID=CAMNT_0021231959 /DNA_START=74 /DNA_END=448 /DNA_ORIENTATION=-